MCFRNLSEIRIALFSLLQILTTAYKTNTDRQCLSAEQSIVDIILRSAEVHVVNTKRALWDGQQFHTHMQTWISVLYGTDEWMSARPLHDLQLHTKVTESHSSPWECCWTLQVCRSRLHLQCILHPMCSTSALSVGCLWMLGEQQVARNHWKFQIGISGSLPYQSLPISSWVVIRGVKWESAKCVRYFSCYS